MNVLCIHSHCAPSYIRGGWGNAFRAAGHNFYFWDTSTKSAFDAFDETKPDLFLGTTYNLDAVQFKCIKERPDMKVALFCSCWGDFTKELDTQKYPMDVAKDEEKSIIEKLRKETGKPDVFFIHYHDDYIDYTLGGWREIGVEPIGIMNAADIVIHKQGQEKQELKCDVGFVGGYWKYKSENLDKFILPLCDDVSLKVKIFGNQPWPVRQYLGFLRDNLVNDFFTSCTVCPNVSEPHSNKFGFDVIERPFKVFASGGLCVSDKVESLNKHIFGEHIKTYATHDELKDIIKHYQKNEGERQSYIDTGRQIVLDSHTYFDRMSKLLNHLGDTGNSGKMLSVKQEHIEKNH